MIGIRIRPATVDDAATLVEIHRRARDTYYRGVVPDEVLDDPADHAGMRAAYERAVAWLDRTALCAESGGRVVGFAALGPPFEPVEDADPGSVAQLFGLYVVPEHWGQRVGSGLHDESVRRWRQAGVVTARLEVWERNERARAFYLRRGWRPDGHERPGPGGHPYLRLVLSLS